MIVTFEEEYLQQLHEDGKCKDIKHRYQPDIVQQNMGITLKGVAPHMITNNLTPSQPIHPGEMIKDEIEYRGISQKDLAAEIGIPASVLNAVLNGKRAVTTEYALLLEAALGIDADIWLKIQADYNKQVAKSDPTFMERINRIRKVAAFL